jgi:hypothetical protein
MIEARREQLHFGEGLIAEEVSDLREEWMKHADQVLEDEQLVATVYEALAKRSPKSRTHGRRGTPAEVVLRLLLLKHIRNWSYAVFDKMVKIPESENQIITDYVVYEKRPTDSELVIPALDAHQKKLGCTPRLVAGDAAFYSAKNEPRRTTEVSSVCASRIAPPKAPSGSANKTSAGSSQGQKWRTGCEGRISVLKRRHGLRRRIYRGDTGMKRWVGLGVIADNLRHIGTVLSERKN